MTSSRGPATELAYHRLHELGRPGRWRALVGVVLFVLVLLVAVQLAAFGLVGIGDVVDAEVSTDPVSPLGLTLVNLTWALAIPIAWLVLRVVHGLRPGWLASVVRRLRWRWFAICLGLSMVALVATLLVSMLLPAQGGGEISGEPNEFTTTVRDFVLVVVLLTPLQAAGEEYAFRGYLTQAVGGLTRSVWPAVVVPALLFALAHGVGQSWPIFFDRLAFGLVAGVLVILTGGLEAGIAMHVLNNFLAFGLALSFGDMDSALNPTGGTWWSIPVTLTQSLVYLGLAVYVARRLRLRTTAKPHELVGSGARV